MEQSIKNVVFWLVIVVSAFFLWQTVRSGSNQQQSPEISYSEFLSQVETGNVTAVTITGTEVSGQYRNNNRFLVTSPGNQDGMVTALRDKNVQIWFRNPAHTDGRTALLNLAPLILLAVLWFFMIRQMKQRTSQPPGGSNPNYPQ